MGKKENREIEVEFFVCSYCRLFYLRLKDNGINGVYRYIHVVYIAENTSQVKFFGGTPCSSGMDNHNDIDKFSPSNSDLQSAQLSFSTRNVVFENSVCCIFLSNISLCEKWQTFYM